MSYCIYHTLSPELKTIRKIYSKDKILTLNNIVNEERTLMVIIIIIHGPILHEKTGK